MNFFDPPDDVRTGNEPLTLKRFGWSLSRGVLLGGGLAAGLFALVWGGKLFSEGAFDPWLLALGWAVPLGALELWASSNVFTSSRVKVWLLRGLAVALGAVAAFYLYTAFSRLSLTDWAAAHPEFVTLVVVCAIVGVLAVRGGTRLWLRHRGRVVLWFAAAAALWAAGEWAVKLGVVQDMWNDPRVELAFNTVIATGALVMIGVLGLMDWNIRRREAEDTMEGAPSERTGLNNG